MSNDKLIDDILELVIGDMGCHHEVDRDEDGVHVSDEYSFNDEKEIRGKIGELIEEAKEKPKVNMAFVNKYHRGMTEVWPKNIVVDIKRLVDMLEKAGVEVMK